MKEVEEGPVDQGREVKKSFLASQFEKFNEINRRYAEPKIKMTRTVKISLIGLKIYLIFLILVLAYKFYTLVRV